MSIMKMLKRVTWNVFQIANQSIIEGRGEHLCSLYKRFLFQTKLLYIGGTWYLELGLECEV